MDGMWMLLLVGGLAAVGWYGYKHGWFKDGGTPPTV